jgi:diadenosine tetraphosphatase ApaH/serine/threonine PP2A family protein phosphatase
MNAGKLHKFTAFTVLIHPLDLSLYVRRYSSCLFYLDECLQKYGNANVWKYCCDVFDYLTLGALIDERVLCVHGGMSPDIHTLDDLRTIPRCQEIPHVGPFCDIVWSDPDEGLTGAASERHDEAQAGHAMIAGNEVLAGNLSASSHWALSPRGAGYLFGGKVVQAFNYVNDLRLICRAHQLVQEGYKFMFPEKSLLTLWSAPNYCYRCGNVAAILSLKPGQTDVMATPFASFGPDKAVEPSAMPPSTTSIFRLFREVPDSQRPAPTRLPAPAYFV